jgi:hypothetical protein
MGRDGRSYDVFVIGPSGEQLTRADLPPPDLKRWVSRCKAEVVLAVQGGLMTIDEARERYRLSREEFVSWQHRLMRDGIAGLKVGYSRTHGHTSRH